MERGSTRHLCTIVAMAPKTSKKIKDEVIKQQKIQSKTSKKKDNDKLSEIKFWVKKAAIAAAKAKDKKVNSFYMCGNNQSMLFVGALEDCPQKLSGKCTWGDIERL